MLSVGPGRRERKTIAGDQRDCRIVLPCIADESRLGHVIGTADDDSGAIEFRGGRLKDAVGSGDFETGGLLTSLENQLAPGFGKLQANLLPFDAASVVIAS